MIQVCVCECLFALDSLNAKAGLHKRHSFKYPLIIQERRSSCSPKMAPLSSPLLRPPPSLSFQFPSSFLVLSLMSKPVALHITAWKALASTVTTLCASRLLQKQKELKSGGWLMAQWATSPATCCACSNHHLRLQTSNGLQAQVL